MFRVEDTGERSHNYITGYSPSRYFTLHYFTLHYFTLLDIVQVDTILDLSPYAKDEYLLGMY